MKITDIFKKSKRTFSFEFFPAKSYQTTLELGINIGQLLTLNPSFVSVTYGAGGSTQGLTFDLVDYIQNKLGMTAMAHYTCINATIDKIENDFKTLRGRNIENLMLLRGDVPRGKSVSDILSGDFKHASDLIGFAKKMYSFCIGAAGYPEKHPESSNQDSDIWWLKNKIDTGADFIISQMFFNNLYYYDFVKKAQGAGISTRIIPGIIPITNYKQIKKISELSGTKIPNEIHERMEPHINNPDKMHQIGVDIATAQCIDLLENGAPGIHFYTLNKSTATVDIFSSLPSELKN